MISNNNTYIKSEILKTIYDSGIYPFVIKQKEPDFIKDYLILEDKTTRLPVQRNFQNVREGVEQICKDFERVVYLMKRTRKQQELVDSIKELLEELAEIEEDVKA